MRLFYVRVLGVARGLVSRDIVKLIIFNVPVSILLHAGDSIRSIRLSTEAP